jgi:AcrR family transcriptional regulator
MWGMVFQRARSEEQREIRRQAILDTAAAMLEVMPVSEVTLNELSRRAGLAKSNVLRYFESREAILLELLDRAAKLWLSELPGQLAAGVAAEGTPGERADQLAVVLARSVAPQRQLCDLLSSQASVLEHNVSAEVVARYKRAMSDNHVALTELALGYLPELGDDGAWRACAMAMVFIGALWSYTQHPASVLAAYEADPSLAVLRLDFTPALEEALATLLSGTLARAGARPGR